MDKLPMSPEQIETSVATPPELTCITCKVGQPKLVSLTLAGKKKEYFRVSCSSCGSLGPVKDSESQAKLAWHRRTRNRVTQIKRRTKRRK